MTSKVRRIDSTNTHIFTYDFANRLKSWTYQGNTVQYDYDAAGNLKNPHGKTLTFNAANEVEGFTYDDAGNLLQDDRYQYTWDGEGRLLSVKDVNGNTIASFTYRPDGLRETKTVHGVTYHYHYDGSNLIRITDDSGQTVWAFTWANGKPNTVTNQNSDTFYYVTNYRGDIVRIVDENGATVANYSYDPWGKVLSVSENASVAGQPLGYAGYYYDRETKLYYLQARYYDPETARFISRDPDPGDQDDPITQNAYTYANDNPVMMMDPNGYFAVAIPVIYAAALAVLGVGLVYYAVQTLDAVSKLIEQSFARVKKRPKYKSKTELHHIVAQKAGKAEPARRILEKVGIGVNDKENLVRIKTGLHRRLHTTKYYQAVNTIIGSVYNTKYGRKVNRKRVVAALEAIRTWLEVQSFLSPF